MTDTRGTASEPAGAPSGASAGEGTAIATAALVGAAERVLGQVIGVPADDLAHIVRGLSLLAKHLFGHRHPK